MLSCVQLSVTPWIIVCQAPLSMGFPRQEYWSREPYPSPVYVLNPEIKPRSPALQAGSLPPEPPAQLYKACVTSYLSLCKCWTVNNYWLFKVLLTVSALGCSFPFQFTSVQFSRSVVSDSMQPHELQHSRPPCPSPTPRVYWNSCPLSQQCHPTISSSVIPFFSCLQSFPASGPFQMSQLFASGGQSIGVLASTPVLPMNTQDWSPLGLTGWIPLQSKGLSRVFSSTAIQKYQFFGAQPSLWSNYHIQKWLLGKPLLWLYDICLQCDVSAF